MLVYGYEIGKRWTFDASHQLDGLPADHKCSRLHGHTYTVEVAVEAGTVDDVGFVLDYGELAPVKAWIDRFLDHRHLNDVDGLGNPTAENLAKFLADVVTAVLDLDGDHAVGSQKVQLAYVRVQETPNTWATFRPRR